MPNIRKNADKVQKIDKRAQIQKEAIAAIMTNYWSGILCIYMRVGKSKIIIDALNKQTVFGSALWVTDKVNLRDVKIPEEFDKWGAKHLLSKVDIICSVSLHKVTKDYDIIIYDELQNITELSMTYFRTRTKPYLLLGMTGFLPKGKEKKELLKELGLKVIYEYGQDQAIADDIIADFRITVMSIPLSKKKDILIKRKKLPDYYTSEELHYNQFDKMINIAQAQRNFAWAKSVRINRQRFLHSLGSKISVVKNYLAAHPDERYLIFNPTKKVADQTCQYVHYNKPKIDSYDDFQDEKINHMSVVQKVSTGDTFYNMDGTIHMGADSNLNGIFSQKGARAFMYREDYVANMIMLIALGTQEEVWLKSSLEPYDKSKITFIHHLQNPYI